MNMSRSRRFLLAVAAPAVALVFAVIFSAVVLLVAGSNPITAFGDMIENASKLETLIDILNRATPLYISGVAAAIGFRMNLFNIGVEGQYILAAFFAAAAGGAVDLPLFLHLVFIFFVAITVGSLWAGLAGWLKVARGVNEVIGTIMLNFIAISGIVAWLSVEWREGGITTNSGTKFIADSGRMPGLNGFLEIFTRDVGAGRELSGVLLIAIIVGVLYYLFINRSRLGFDLRISGYNAGAARVAGVPPNRMIVLAMMLGGACAGLVGMVDILSRHHRYDVNFTGGLGFAGIAVALLGRNSPVGIAFAALLFAFMTESSGVLQISGSASPEIVVIMQGVILLTAVIAYESISRVRQREEARAAADALAGAAT